MDQSGVGVGRGGAMGGSQKGCRVLPWTGRRHGRSQRGSWCVAILIPVLVDVVRRMCGGGVAGGSGSGGIFFLVAVVGAADGAVVRGRVSGGGLGGVLTDVARKHAVVEAEQTQGPTAACVCV